MCYLDKNWSCFAYLSCILNVVLFKYQSCIDKEYPVFINCQIFHNCLRKISNKSRFHSSSKSKTVHWSVDFPNHCLYLPWYPRRVVERSPRECLLVEHYTPLWSPHTATSMSRPYSYKLFLQSPNLLLGVRVWSQSQPCELGSRCFESATIDLHHILSKIWPHLTQ